MAENGPIEDLAKIISNKIFERFFWKKVGPNDQDFPCGKEESHKPKGKKQTHTHPVDAVFCYKDPYLNKTIYLNTDLKSYGKKSIQVKKIEDTLASLAKTIDCARYSIEWQNKYNTEHGSHDVRGLLFVYNHDNNFEHNFYDYFNPPKPKPGKRRPKSVNLDNLCLQKDQQIHIIEPTLISYLMAIISDMNELIAEKKFPSDNSYSFYYPQLTYHKVLVEDRNLPATIELLTAPFLIIKHDAVVEYDNQSGLQHEKFNEGYILYYNRSGESEYEFMYLFDLLASYQILDLKNQIRIRVASSKRNDSIRSNFTRAIEKFAHEWGYDNNAKKKLYSIELHLVPTVKTFYSSEERSWG